MNFPPATRAPAVPDKRLKHDVAMPAPVKIAGAKPTLRLTGETPGEQLEDFNRVAAIGTDGSGRRKHTQKPRKRRPPNKGTARGLVG